MGSKRTSRKTQEMLMIAAHGWDLAGASHAGLATCFIAREGQSLYTLSST
jgi:2-haloacid dehalogenase